MSVRTFCTGLNLSVSYDKCYFMNGLVIIRYYYFFYRTYYLNQNTITSAIAADTYSESCPWPLTVCWYDNVTSCLLNRRTDFFLLICVLCKLWIVTNSMQSYFPSLFDVKSMSSFIQPSWNTSGSFRNLTHPCQALL